MSHPLVAIAAQYVGQPFHLGQSAQCAAFCWECMGKAGYAGPRPANPSWVPDYSGADNGEPIGGKVPFASLAPGDLVIFDRTYLAATSTHIGIVEQGGPSPTMIHRGTSEGVVSRASLLVPYWRSRFATGLRLQWLPAAPAAPQRSPWFKLYLQQGRTQAVRDGHNVEQLDLRA